LLFLSELSPEYKYRFLDKIIPIYHPEGGGWGAGGGGHFSSNNCNGTVFFLKEREILHFPDYCMNFQKAQM
jgi:hypothetical protein